MSRPVAMESNLHNVLFVPADGVLYVANASHGKPAAEMPYMKVDLKGVERNSRGPASNKRGGEAGRNKQLAVPAGGPFFERCFPRMPLILPVVLSIAGEDVEVRLSWNHPGMISTVQDGGPGTGPPTVG